MSLTVAVRLLSGEELHLTCEPSDTVAQLRQALSAERDVLRRCKLNLRGLFLEDDDRPIGDLSLRAGEFLVAFETRKKKKQRVAGLPASGTPSGTASQQAQQAHVGQLQPVACSSQQGDRQQQQQQQQQHELQHRQPPSDSTCHTPTGSPRQQWALHGDGGRRRAALPGALATGVAATGEPSEQLALIASPGKLDTLLPGYLSRPNPSPIKARLLRAPSHVSGAPQLDPTGASTKGEGAEVDSVAGGASVASAASGQQPGSQPAAKRARSLLNLAVERFGSNAAPNIHSNSIREPDFEPALAQAEQHAPGGPLAALHKHRAGLKAGSPAGTMQHLLAGLKAELQQAAELVLTQQPHQQEDGSALHTSPAANGSGDAAVSTAQATAQPPPPRRRTVTRGVGSKRKQPAPPSAAPQQQSATAGEPQGAESNRSHPGTSFPAAAAADIAPSREAVAMQGLLQVSEAELDVAAAALPLPPLAQRLEAAFVVLAQVHAFLNRQHIQATWGHVQQAAEGMRLLRQPLNLADCRLMAALCPEIVALQQHHRIEPRTGGDTWRLAVSSPRKAHAAVAAAAAAEAQAADEGEGQPLPNPMHLRTDGAGTVLAGGSVAARGAPRSPADGGTGPPGGGGGEDDTLVIDVADPGRGFLVRPIDPAFLRHLRRQMLGVGQGSSGASSSLPRVAASARPRSVTATGAGAAAGDEEGEVDVEMEASGGSDVEQDCKADGREFSGKGGRGGEGGEGTGCSILQAAQQGPPPPASRRVVFRVNKLARQRWCFRRAMVRALLLVQQDQEGQQRAQRGKQHMQRQQEGQQEEQVEGALGEAAVAPSEQLLPSQHLSPEQQQQGVQRRDHLGQRRLSRGAGASRAAAGSPPQKTALLEWRAGFDPAAVTAAQLAAAGERLSAPARAAAAAAEQEAQAVDALAAARRSRRTKPLATRGTRAETTVGGVASAAAAEAAAPPAVYKAAAKPPQLLKQHAPCTDTTEMGAVQFLAHLRRLPWYQGQAVHIEQLASRQAQHAAPITPLAPAVAAALQLRGVRQLFTHQAAAVDHLLQGKHTVVATSTASGKSLCYTIPILQALAQDRAACALLMFPTKALAQDQLRALRELCAAAFGSAGEGAVPGVEVYDGDTPMGDRGGVRDSVQLLITNPDMLHMSVLPVHQQFGRVLSNLKYVVVDEGHAYKGVFGCHAALVLRRLRRLCDRVYNSQPTFAVTTATLANPREHARELLGVPDVEVVSEDGSPHGPRTFVMWNPPLRQFGSQSHTEARARSRRQQQQAQQRRQRQEANQDRGTGVLEFGSRAGSGSQQPGVLHVSAAKLAKRLQLQVAANGRVPADLAQHQEQKLQHGQQQGRQPVAGSHQQHGELQQPLQALLWTQQQHKQQQQEQQQGAQVAQVPLAAQAQLSREVAEAKAALAAVGGSSSRAPSAPGQQASGVPAGPVRPLIRRQALGAKAALAKMSAVARRQGVGDKARVRHAGVSAGGEDDGDANYSSRLPASKDWKASVGKGSAIPCRVAKPPSALGTSEGTDQNPLDSGGVVRSSSGGISGSERRGENGGNCSCDAEGGDGGAGGEDDGEEADERRSSPIVELSLLLAECVQHGLRTIAFCNTRKLCELVTAYVREILKCTAPHLTGSIAVYRAGYSPAERREIERALFQGNLRAVAATNALELGVDVGSLDCTLHLGFPGSVASLWQQAGRAGRREQPSLGIYLGWDGPLDQFFMRNPGQLFGRPIERALVDPHNPGVLEAHLACAAAEVPLLLDEDQRYFGAGLPCIATSLQSACLLGRHPLAPSSSVLHYVGPAPNPASKVSLRAIDPERFAIMDESSGGQGRLLEEIEESKAFFEVYDGAVYMYQGRTYLCKKLDLDARVAVVRPADVKYYTKCIDYTDVHVRGGRPAFSPHPVPHTAAATAQAPRRIAAAEAEQGAAHSSQQQQGSSSPSAVCSPAVVTVRWLGFRRIWRGTGQVFDTVDLFLPDVQFETEAAFCRLPHATRRRLKEAGLPFREGVHAACHALLNVLPLYLMCNPTDVGTECDNPYDTRFKPERILIYDKHPGGIGLAAAAAPLFPELLCRALELVRECSCSGRSGCPSCIQHTDCGEYNAVLNKRAAVVVLESLLAGEVGEEAAGAGHTQHDEQQQGGHQHEEQQQEQ